MLKSKERNHERDAPCFKHDRQQIFRTQPRMRSGGVVPHLEFSKPAERIQHTFHFVEEGHVNLKTIEFAGFLYFKHGASLNSGLD